MTVKDELVKLLNEDAMTRYVYVSKTRGNMDAVGRHVGDNVDLDKTKGTLFMVHPIGVGTISGPIDGIYADMGATTDQHVRKFLNLNDTGFIKWLDSSTLEIIDDKSS